MGGVFGHMSHLYDNPNLKFSQIKDVFQKASSGELVGTEKTDGQNLFVSYDVRDGTVRAARNKGNIKDGGMKPEALAAKFAGRGPLEETFVDAFDAFALAVSQMPDELKLQLFGPEANIYYNAEVQDPRAANIINYDVKTFNIHRTGHAEYDKETGAAIRDASENAEILEQYLLSAQDTLEGTEYRVQINAIRYLERLDNDSALDEALMRLEKFTSKHGLSDNNTIGEYLVARLDAYLTLKIQDLNIEAKKLLMKRMFQEGYGAEDDEGNKARKVTQREIIGALENPENTQIVKGLINTAKPLLKEFIYPLEDIIHDFSVAMLRGLQSAFVLDSEAEVTRQRAEVSAAIDAIEASGNEEAMGILQQQMRKLKNVERVSTAAEGFVFDYDGNTYKFTGNFAPVNQILGLFKYGRGNVPPLKPLTAADVLNEQIANKGTSFLFIPGGFKPPHKGHLHLLETAIKQLPDAKPYLVTGETPRDGVTLTQAMQIWKIYLQNNRELDLDELSIITVPKGGLPVLDNKGKAMKDAKGKIRISNSPLQAIYNSGLGLPKGAELFIASSEADPGHAAIGKAIKEARPDLNVKAYQVKTLNDPETGGKFSARDIREAVAHGDYETFKKFLPNDDAIRRKSEYIFTNILGGKIKEEEESEDDLEQEEEQPLAESFRPPDLFRLIQEALNEENQPPTLSTPLGPMALSYEPGDLELLRKHGKENIDAYADWAKEKVGKVTGRDWKPGIVTAQQSEPEGEKSIATVKEAEMVGGYDKKTGKLTAKRAAPAFKYWTQRGEAASEDEAGGNKKYSSLDAQGRDTSGKRAVGSVTRDQAKAYAKANPIQSRQQTGGVSQHAIKSKASDYQKQQSGATKDFSNFGKDDKNIRKGVGDEGDPTQKTKFGSATAAETWSHGNKPTGATPISGIRDTAQAKKMGVRDYDPKTGRGTMGADPWTAGMDRDVIHDYQQEIGGDYSPQHMKKDAKKLGGYEPGGLGGHKPGEDRGYRSATQQFRYGTTPGQARKTVKQPSLGNYALPGAPKTKAQTAAKADQTLRGTFGMRGLKEQEELEEMSSMAAGDIEGGMIGTGSKKGPWHDFDAESFNKRQKADSTLKDKEDLIGEIIDYLLEHEV